MATEISSPPRPPSGGSSRLIRFGGFAVVCVAVMARVLVLYQTVETPYFANPVLDAETNWLTAIEWAEGDGPERPFFKSPLYPWLLGQGYALSGVDATDETEAIALITLIQSLIAIFAAWGVWRMGLALAGGVAGVVAGLAFACCGSLIHFEGELLDTSLVTSLLALGIWPLVTAQRPIPYWRILLAGALLGLATITRPTCGAVALVACLWCVVAHRRRAGVWLGGLPRATALAVPVAGLIALVSWANNWEALIATYGGPNFWLANHEGADGFTTKVPQIYGAPEPGEDYIERFTMREAAERLGVESITSVEAEAFWWREGFEYWRASPLDALTAMGRRGLFFWQGPEIKNNKSLPFVGSQIPALGALLMTVGWFWIAPLGLVGLITARHFHRPGARAAALLIALCVLVIFLSGLPFPINTRYRLPALPFLALGSGITAACVMRSLVRVRIQSLIVTLLWCAALIAVARLDWTGTEPDDTARDWWQLGNLATAVPMYDDAEAAYAEALRQNPDYIEAHVNLARVWILRGRVGEAQARLEQVTTQAPTYSVAWDMLAEVYEMNGDTERAEAARRQFVE